MTSSQNKKLVGDVMVHVYLTAIQHEIDNILYTWWQEATKTSKASAALRSFYIELKRSTYVYLPVRITYILITQKYLHMFIDEKFLH